MGNVDVSLEEMGDQLQESLKRVVIGGLKGRGKRKDVQISGKEVRNFNQGESSTVRSHDPLPLDKQFLKRGERQQKFNQAAAKNEHTVVVGMQGGKKIERIVVRSENDFALGIDVPGDGTLVSTEYHQDPPNENVNEGALVPVVVIDGNENGDIPSGVCASDEGVTRGNVTGSLGPNSC